MDQTIKIFNSIKESIVKLSELQNTLYRLETNIIKVQTRSNALKDIIIPSDEKTEKNIADALEERDREEFTKLKVIKNSHN